MIDRFEFILVIIIVGVEKLEYIPLIIWELIFRYIKY